MSIHEIKTQDPYETERFIHELFSNW